MRWRKSSYSSSNGTCVEVAADGANVYVRNSNHPERGTLTLSVETWQAIIAGAKSGELDDLI